ncbi:FeoB-associated Cys-rich membrane protein [Macrococcus sp. DPC7161]|uniref:FeoB-associated Cys-rich membrane protein n=1 Tax=Macrococcus sp. DPC7161 TaxID=2507060 RepID=UPI00100C2F5F|nr:FeoB-associated Cys-rich membrane protein [Macrococcus sp. DPC7161]RXK17767.1 FeoB-associated Cys-rich membrane protein [Macrococcus sp. DPC7161]
MTLLINAVLILAIFGYAAYTLIKFFKKSKEGKCNTCSSNCHCETQINIDTIKDKR